MDTTAALGVTSDAFSHVIKPATLKPTGSNALGFIGVYEANKCMHWTTWIDISTGRAWLAVTALGMKYTGWPLATFLIQELADPRLLTVIREREAHGTMETAWRCNAWQGAGRVPRFDEQNLTHGIDGWESTTSISAARYTALLSDALALFDESRNHRGRRPQMQITVNDGKKIFRDVSPEFQVRTRVDISSGKVAAVSRSMESAMELLQPIYDIATQRSVVVAG